MRLRFDGEIYKGFDGADVVSATKGDIVEISEAKVEQLLRDYPIEWQLYVDDITAINTEVKSKKAVKKDG